MQTDILWSEMEMFNWSLQRTSILTTTEERFREIFEVNVTTPLLPWLSLPKLQCTDVQTKVLLSWRFCQLYSHKTSLVLQAQAFDGGWNATYLKDETCTGKIGEGNCRSPKSIIPLGKGSPQLVRTKKPPISYGFRWPKGLYNQVSKEYFSLQ